MPAHKPRRVPPLPARTGGHVCSPLPEQENPAGGYIFPAPLPLRTPVGRTRPGRYAKEYRRLKDMLEDYIRQYEGALATKDKATMGRIEKQLKSLGMDRATLLILVGERKKKAGS